MSVFDPNSIRREIKFKIFQSDLPKLELFLFSDLSITEVYPPRDINSLYLDTPNYDFAISNMSGESRRLKVRGRWYSKMGSNRFNNNRLVISDFLQCEIKRKINNISDKITIRHDLFAAQHQTNMQNVREYCKNFVKINGYEFYDSLIDVVLITYSRKYYISNVLKGLRLTLDQNIRYSPAKTNLPSILLSKDYVILELKFDPAMLDEVNKLLKEFPFLQTRFSKYLSAISQIKRVSY